MGFAPYPVHDRIAHDQIRMGHVDFCPQSFRSVRVFPPLHFREELKIFFDGTVSVRAIPPRRSYGDVVLVFNRRPAVLADFSIG